MVDLECVDLPEFILLNHRKKKVEIEHILIEYNVGQPTILFTYLKPNRQNPHCITTTNFLGSVSTMLPAANTIDRAVEALQSLASGSCQRNLKL